MDYPPIAALEVGSSHVRVVIGEIREDDHIQVVGLGEAASQGIKKGEITDMDAAVDAVKIALQKAEEHADVEIKRVYVSISGMHMASIVNRASLPISGDREILEEHVEHIQSIAKSAPLNPDREIIHSICQHYRVDGHGGVVNPVGMEATKLELDMLIIHGQGTRIRNLVKLVRSVPLEVADTPLAGLCTALAVLSPHEKDIGALVVDIGAGTMDYLGYANGCITVAGSLGVGGDHVTNDIIKGIGVSFPEAARIKELHGSASINLADRLRRLDLPANAGPQGRKVRLGDLHTITSLRSEEMLAMVKTYVDQGDLLQRFGAGIILTGGGSRLSGLTDLAEKMFGMSCHIGRARDISGLADLSAQPEYATALGLLRYAARQSRREAPGGLTNILRRWILRVG